MSHFRHINITRPTAITAAAVMLLAPIPVLASVDGSAGASGPAVVGFAADTTPSHRAVDDGSTGGEGRVLDEADVAPVPPMLAELGAAFALGFSFSSPTPAAVPLDLQMRLSYPGHELAPGMSEPAVSMLQRRLAELDFDPGAIDGLFSEPTTFAVTSFQKFTGRAVTGVVDEETWLALADPLGVAPMVTGAADTRIEVDLDRQVLVVWREDRVALITRITSGSSATPTPPGSFTVTRRITGWRVSRLGRLYNPLYFNDGIAFHGYLSLPTHPASHGCVRLPMYIAEYFPSLVENGVEVYVVDREHPGVARVPKPVPEPAPSEPSEPSVEEAVPLSETIAGA